MQTGLPKQPSSSLQTSPRKQPVMFVLSVDTEEEFDWDGDFPQTACQTDNIEQLPEFHAFCSTLDIRPTYLVDYAVAQNPVSAAILRDIASTRNAEIGAHLHPWCTPPLQALNGEVESHVVNLPKDIVHQKLTHLTQLINDNIGVRPRCFRTGRWGINSTTLKSLIDQGYKVDSSVYPYYSNDYFSCQSALDKPYWPDPLNPNRAGAQQDIFELPVTAGFNRSNAPFWSKIHQFLAKPQFELFHPIGIAWKLKILRKIYLSPELSNTADMISLVEASLKSHHPVIHMFIHSSTLLPGKNQFTRNEKDKQALYYSIEQVLDHLIEHYDVSFCTISEASRKLQAGFNNYVPPKQ
ncbi:hypothetical protein A9Q99_20240 [Gammaproteobacteria bacterium 45_16_T64]|nr:hypothetical protein A9Q99_20240 [Gammaproteobacteria bacterium 45_16_T64]